jgi:hypothetical protein
MIVNLFNTALGFALLAALPLLVLALLSAIPAARQPASIKNATIWEAMIRALFSAYFLGAVFLVVPSIEGTFRGFGTQGPPLAELTLGLARAIRNFVSIPAGSVFLILGFAVAVATDAAIYNHLGAKDVRRSRRFSIIVSVVTLGILGVMAASLLLPFIELLNDLS